MLVETPIGEDDSRSLGGSPLGRAGGAAEAGGKFSQKLAASLSRTVSWMQTRTGMQALLLLILVLSGCSSRPLTAARVAPPMAVLRGASGGGGAPPDSSTPGCSTM